MLLVKIENYSVKDLDVMSHLTATFHISALMQQGSQTECWASLPLSLPPTHCLAQQRPSHAPDVFTRSAQFHEGTVYI